MTINRYSVAEDCGRFFEVGFNIGILTYLRQHSEQFRHHLQHLYLHDISELHFPEMVKSSFKRHAFTIDAHKREVARQWFLFFLQKGYLAGLSFFAEYIQSLGWNPEMDPIELAYYQCSFVGENSIYTLSKTDEQEWHEILTQLTHYHIDPLTINLAQHRQKGRFLKADTLLLLRLEERWRILCLDLSIFSVSSDEALRDPSNVSMLREQLLRDLSYLRAKSVFANLSIDTARGAPGFSFSTGLDTYLTAFKHDDKESAKLIQAGSYAHDFYQVLTERGLFTSATEVTFNIIGYTDRGINAITCSEQNLELLARCARIYRHETSGATIQQARQEVLETIRANAARSFEDGLEWTENMMALVKGAEDNVHWVTPAYREEIRGFVNPSAPVPLDRLPEELKGRLASLSRTPLESLSLRDAHQQLILDELSASNDTLFLFLTGSPGIGKTTAIVRFLEAHREEGFLLIYVSPRKQVNIDIINKFRDVRTKVLPGNLLALTADSDIIRENHGDLTVNYYAAHRSGDFLSQGLKKRVQFVDAERREEGRIKRYASRLTSLSEERIWDRGESASGVLDSICNALYISLRDDLSRELVATVSIQSLKRFGQGSEAHDTLVHLKKIFQGATKRGRVLPDEMRKLSSRIKHLFIMIDEVTGDESGVAFLEGIRKFVRDYELTQHGFNTRIIVADASIVDHEVIKQHIQGGANEYEPDKIYFRTVAGTDVRAPLSRTPFLFHKKAAVAINANAYPASQLAITYHVCLEFLKFQEGMLQGKDRLGEQLQQRMIDDIEALLKREEVPQIIVYIQDKRRLARLIETLRARLGRFEKHEDYVAIHASISERDREEIGKVKERVRVVFMTASASRGLSFPRATHILVDIPHFEIEQNLMEIIQVIYRGRGDAEIEQQAKELLFYISERAIYYDESAREISLRESILNVLNILLILKTAIMTRIVGYGQVGRQRLMIIPIGGKSVLAAGETYSAVLERLITELRREYLRNYDKPWLKEVYMSLRALLSQADFDLSPPREGLRSTPREQVQTYLSLLPTFTSRFTDSVYNGLHRLLEWEPIEPSYLTGGLLIVPTNQKQLHERYLMQLEEKLRRAKESDLYRRMQYIARSDEYPSNLRNAMQRALELLERLNDASPEKTQILTQESGNADQYYVLPLLAFMQEKALREHFAAAAGEPEEYSFRWLLAASTRAFCPITSLLPIGDEYEAFPFLLFRSFNLQEMRNRIFSETHLLISNEMNVLNMLLTYRDEQKKE